MFGIGGFELFIILIFGFLIFGPDKLPEIAKTVGKGIARFREAQQEMNDTLGGEKIFDPNNPDEPFKDPVEVLDRIAQKQEEKKAAKADTGGAKARMDAAAAGVATSTGAAATSSSANAGAEADEAPARQESFTERKARYERERAARKAAEKAAAEDKNVTGDGGVSHSAQGETVEETPASSDVKSAVSNETQGEKASLVEVTAAAPDEADSGIPAVTGGDA